MNHIIQHKPKLFYQARFLVLLFLSVLYQACAVTPTPVVNEQSESFTEYTEALFRRQNQASSSLMVLTEEDFSEEEYQALLIAEQEMHKACRSFNEYASILSEGLNPGIFLRNKVYQSLDECDSATNDLEIMLQQLQ